MFRRRKFCRFTAEKVEWIDYKDLDTLKDFVGENGKIIPARITGTSAGYQRQLSAQGRCKHAERRHLGACVEPNPILFVRACGHDQHPVVELRRRRNPRVDPGGGGNQHRGSRRRIHLNEW